MLYNKIHFYNILLSACRLDTVVNGLMTKSIIVLVVHSGCHGQVFYGPRKYFIKRYAASMYSNNLQSWYLKQKGREMNSGEVFVGLTQATLLGYFAHN